MWAEPHSVIITDQIFFFFCWLRGETFVDLNFDAVTARLKVKVHRAEPIIFKIKHPANSQKLKN